MRSLFFLFLACLMPGAYAGGHEEPLSNPKALLRIVTALEQSKEDGLVSGRPNDGGTETYHLKSAELLGTVSRGAETFYLARAVYIRSRPKGSETPPARGHSYLVVLSSDFALASHSYRFEGGCHLEGNVLKKGDKVLVDFAANILSARHHGYALLGDLPYFFSDKITDEQWEDDEFIKKEAAKE